MRYLASITFEPELHSSGKVLSPYHPDYYDEHTPPDQIEEITLRLKVAEEKKKEQMMTKETQKLLSKMDKKIDPTNDTTGDSDETTPPPFPVPPVLAVEEPKIHKAVQSFAKDMENNYQYSPISYPYRSISHKWTNKEDIIDVKERINTMFVLPTHTIPPPSGYRPHPLELPAMSGIDVDEIIRDEMVQRGVDGEYQEINLNRGNFVQQNVEQTNNPQKSPQQSPQQSPPPRLSLGETKRLYEESGLFGWADDINVRFQREEDYKEAQIGLIETIKQKKLERKRGNQESNLQNDAETSSQTQAQREEYERQQTIKKQQQRIQNELQQYNIGVDNGNVVYGDYDSAMLQPRAEIGLNAKIPQTNSTQNDEILKFSHTNENDWLASNQPR
jgi:hypothetical protein